MPAPDSVQMFLPLVARPARYAGGEIGARDPDPQERLRVVLAFPDVYEVGMCNNGLLFLYESLNDVPGVTCERVFAPDTDMAARLRVRDIPLYSLETGRPVRSADILAVTLPSPVNYTSALTLFSLSRVPLLSSERRDENPIVIVGGHAVFNPEPFNAFADACCVGEGDEAVVEIARLIIELKERDAARQEKIEALAGIGGVYVPSLYEPGPGGNLKARAPAPPTVKKRAVADIGELRQPVSRIIAWVPPVHDRAVLEIARGCAQACRFCQAGMATRPYRERPAGNVLQTAREAVAATGTNDISLLGLNPGDYSALVEVVARLQTEHPGIRLSLPALRLETYDAAAAAAVSAEKPGQQTFAPETGTERLRTVINKDITDADVLDGVRTAGAGGVQRVKLYFMLGLPTETDDDVVAIADLAARADSALRDGLGRWGQITVNVSAFVPQAHTPFQWLGQVPLPELKRRFGLLRKHLSRKIKLRADDPAANIVEAALARGGRELGPIILDAYLHGARRDGWSEAFRYDVWRNAFARAGLDLETCASRPLDLDKPLPWDHVDVGLSAKFLLQEYEKAFAGRLTANCLAEPCAACGVCSRDLKIRRYETVEPCFTSPPAPDRTKKVTRIRFTYEKKGLRRFLGHLDLSRLVIMLFARAGVPVTYSRGFSRKPRLELAPALPTGCAGTDERGDVWLYADLSPDDFLKLVSKGAAELGVKYAALAGADARSLAREINYGEYVCDFAAAAAVGGLDLDAVYQTIKKNADAVAAPTDDGPYILFASLGPETTEFTIALVNAPDGRGLSLFDAAGELAGIKKPLSRCIVITRVKCGRYDRWKTASAACITGGE